MLDDNIALITSRQGQASDLQNWNVAFVTDKIVDLNIFRRGGGCVFPLYSYEETLGKTKKKANISDEVIKNFSQSTQLRYSENEKEKTSTFNAYDIFAYIYAILFSIKYRTEYKEFLNLEFPRIPIPKNADEFTKLARLGSELIEIHIMSKFDEKSGMSIPTENLIVESVYYSSGRLYVNKQKSICSISQNVWDYQIGGYPVIGKWLKDRKGSVLSSTEYRHLFSIINAIEKTIDYSCEIDEIITI